MRILFKKNKNKLLILLELKSFIIIFYSNIIQDLNNKLSRKNKNSLLLKNLF